MKSKSFDLTLSTDEIGKHKVLDFVGLYKSASETDNILSQQSKPTEGQKNAGKGKGETSMRKSNNYKKKNKSEVFEVSHINIDGSNLNPNLHNSSPQNEHRATSTPNTSGRSKSHPNKVKSIMKNAPVNGDDIMDDSELNISYKPKKRNKSVSFMLDDSEEVVTKKTKSNNPEKGEKNKQKSIEKTKSRDEKRKSFQKLRKAQYEKENNVSERNNQMDTDVGDTQAQGKKSLATGDKTKHMATNIDTTGGESIAQGKKKKFNKDKKQKKEVVTDATDTNKDGGTDQAEVKNKKTKKKKRQAKSQIDAVEADGEPAFKSRKKDAKPDGIAEDLENLNIGDNPHTLTNLLDEMTVVDKEKRKKLRQKFNKKPREGVLDSEKGEGQKEKVKWKRRKWNKDKKGGFSNDSIATSVIVEGLPIYTITSYKKLLADQFQKYGLIKKIGIAEVSTEDSKPVFSTTIMFYSDGAAQQALEEDNTMLANCRIRLKRPLPPTETTLVVHTYAGLTEQALSSIFSGAGRIRSIRTLIKGKKTMGTAFIEFDGPEALQRALELAAKTGEIAGKKMHASKYDLRQSKKEKKPEVNTESEKTTAESGDSEDSD